MRLVLDAASVMLRTQRFRSWEFGSVVENLPSTGRVLGWIPSTEGTERQAEGARVGGTRETSIVTSLGMVNEKPVLLWLFLGRISTNQPLSSVNSGN